MALSIKGLYVTLSINDTQHNNVLPYAECRYAECHILFIVMLSINMLNAVMLSVVAPFLQTCYSALIPTANFFRASLFGLFVFFVG
jgi:hypothetical protein